MSYWNYRVIERDDIPKKQRMSSHWYELHEVYYDDDDNPISLTELGSSVCGETLDELKHCLSMMLSDAHKHPVIKWSYFDKPAVKKRAEKWISGSDTINDRATKIKPTKKGSSK